MRCAAAAPRKRRAISATTPGSRPADAARHSVETARASVYRFDELKSRTDPPARLARLGLGLPSGSSAAAVRAGIRVGTAIAAGSDLARDLGNRPANVCTPSHLADAARDIAKRFARMDVKVLDEADMRRLGMGALLCVTQGADEPPRMIVLQYRGTGAKEAPIALCGKGVTFDTGGISIKPAPKMDEMKFDMCGAGGVLGAMTAIGELQPAHQRRRDHPGLRKHAGRARHAARRHREEPLRPNRRDHQHGRGRPPDPLRRDHLREALQAALHHRRRNADGRLRSGARPRLHGSLLQRRVARENDLLEAADRSLDLAWRLPVHEEYGESLRSNFADFANSGTRDGGASVGANFLSRFVDGLPWAHLDIAGVAWRANANKGATGRPVPLLVDFLLNAGGQ